MQPGNALCICYIQLVHGPATARRQHQQPASPAERPPCGAAGLRLSACFSQHSRCTRLPVQPLYWPAGASQEAKAEKHWRDCLRRVVSSHISQKLYSNMCVLHSAHQSKSYELARRRKHGTLPSCETNPSPASKSSPQSSTPLTAPHPDVALGRCRAAGGTALCCTVQKVLVAPLDHRFAAVLCIALRMALVL